MRPATDPPQASAPLALAPRLPRRRTGPGAVRRALKHPRVMPYQRLIALVLLANVGILLAGAGGLADLAALTLANLAGAVLIRQQHVLNVLFGLAGRGSTGWPLWLRWSVSKVGHVGGLHAGCALAGTAWLCAFTVTALTGPATATTRVAASAIALLCLIVVAGALPVARRRVHNAFELSHRFGGWSAVALFWVLTVHLALLGDEPAAHAIATSWQVWVLGLLTLSIAAPWLRLRRVPVTVERPSGHAAIVTIAGGRAPAVASAVGISRSPLREWHAFATVTTPGRDGFRLLVSRAGDWTGRFVDDPPSHVWMRGVPTAAPMARVEVLYERVVYVATGSGIGPVLGQILAGRVDARLVWSARNPRATYGDALVDEVEAAHPHALIWDTAERGKPDLLALARDACRDFGAEAVFVVSNQAATQRIVHGLERLGIPAFGPIWDS
jgi:hypothetical protein